MAACLSFSPIRMILDKCRTTSVVYGVASTVTSWRQYVHAFRWHRLEKSHPWRNVSMAMPGRPSTATMLNKVPEVTIYFWVIKVLATTVGETAADFLSTTLNLGLTGTSFVMGALFALALAIQVVRKSYVPWIYWLTVVLISVVGTLITDNLVDNLGIGLEATTIAFGIALAVVFAVWYAVERTLSIHTIVTTRRELFYWAAILFTFALGTAGGDLASEGLGLGYGQAAFIFAALIAVVAGFHFLLKLD